MATGSDPLSYQWRKDGQLITKEDSSMKQFNTPNLYIHPFSPKHDGNYQCLVTNSFGSTISQAAEMKGMYECSQIPTLECWRRRDYIFNNACKVCMKAMPIFDQQCLFV